MQKFDLEDRLIAFAVECVRLTKKIPKNYEGLYYSKQLIRSSGSAALNYGEVQGAESDKDFIHKMRLVLKELRESLVNIKILYKLKYLEGKVTLSECHELVAIFVKSIQTKMKRIS